MRGFRTDLAMESVGQRQDGMSGVEMNARMLEDIRVTDIHIRTQEAAEHLQKNRGRYTTIEYSNLPKCDADKQHLIARVLSKTVRELLPEQGDVLVIGLGNRNVTADALGTRVVERMLVTRHLWQTMEESVKRKVRSVSAIAPGVLGLTGIETAELCRGLVEHVKPCAVIAIDALAAFDSGRICTTIQVTDTGIHPGSGVGNHRLGLTEETLHVPVIAVGVPMVVYASTIARDALSRLIDAYHLSGDEDQPAADALLRQVSEGTMGEMVVTPREIDELVLSVAEMIGDGLNHALHPKLEDDALYTFMHQ